jgi:hypothetical protein
MEATMGRIRILVLILFTCVVSVQWMQAGKKPTYTTFDAPGALYTFPSCINAGGTIAGSYWTRTT